MVISRRRFAENGKKFTERKRHVKGVQSFCFASLDMQNLRRCRCRRVEDLKLSIQNSEVVESFSTMTVLVRTTFTRKITLKQDLIQHETIRRNVNQIALMKNSVNSSTLARF